jgi:hypothetical protein
MKYEGNHWDAVILRYIDALKARLMLNVGRINDTQATVRKTLRKNCSQEFKRISSHRLFGFVIADHRSALVTRDGFVTPEVPFGE